MSLLGDLAASGLSTVLGIVLKASPVDKDTLYTGMKMVAAAIDDLAEKAKDGKITEDEINDTLAKVGAAGNSAIAIAAESAVRRLIGNIL